VHTFKLSDLIFP